jgi:hypothetical protein
MTMLRNNKVLWTLQGLLALLFLFGGFAKLTMNPSELEAQAHMPALFLQFISVCELLGGIGLIVPWLTGIRRELTPLAAMGLTIIMIGAVGTTLVQGLPVTAAILPFVIGLLLGVIAYGRQNQISGIRNQESGFKAARAVA